MRVLFLHPSDELYGSDRVLLQVIQALRGAELRVLLPDDVPRGLLADRLAEQGVRVERMPLPVVRRRYRTPHGVVTFVSKSIRSMVRLSVLVRRWKPDVIYSNTSAIMIGSPVSSLTGTPHVWHIHEIIEDPQWFRRVVALLTRLGDTHVVAVSTAVAAWVAAAGATQPIVIRNPAPDAEYAPPSPLDPPRILMLGRVNNWKGHRVFAEAAKRLHDEGEVATFRMLGGPVPDRPDAYDDLVRLTAELDPGGTWLTFGGWSPEPLEEMAASVAVVLPSTAPEPLNITALEAMALGRPVIASRTGGLPEVVIDGVTGLLTAPGDVDDVARAIRVVLRDRAGAAEMGLRGRERALAEFSAARYREDCRQVVVDVARVTSERAGPGHRRCR